MVPGPGRICFEILTDMKSDMKIIPDGIKITLGSASPRRKELLEGLGIKFTVETSPGTKEIYDPGTPCRLIPQTLAVAKSEQFHRKLEENEILITADTIVICDDKTLGKPKNKKEAAAMLEALSDKTHEVVTGVCVRCLKGRSTFSTLSKVTFKKLEKEEIEYYIDKYKPFDKAGSYGIQEWIGYIGITSIEGSYYNIVGLPIQRLYTELRRFISIHF